MLRGQEDVGIVPIDTEVAVIWTADAAQERYIAEQGGPAARERGGSDLRHTFCDAGEVIEQAAAGDDSAAVERTVEEILEECFVTVTYHEVEEGEAIHGKGLRMRATDHGHRLLRRPVRSLMSTARSSVRKRRDTRAVSFVCRSPFRI